MLIKIDTREAALLHLIINQVAVIPTFKSLQIKSETLPMGEILLLMMAQKIRLL